MPSGCSGITAGNERVVIAQQDIVPVEIAHPRLPAPKFNPAGLGETNCLGIRPDDAERPDGGAQPSGFRQSHEGQGRQAGRGSRGRNRACAPGGRLKARDARAAASEYRKAEIAFAAAKERFELADRILKRAADDEAIKAAAVARNAAEVRLNEAEGRVGNGKCK